MVFNPIYSRLYRSTRRRRGWVLKRSRISSTRPERPRMPNWTILRRPSRKKSTQNLIWTRMSFLSCCAWSRGRSMSWISIRSSWWRGGTLSKSPRTSETPCLRSNWTCSTWLTSISWRSRIYWGRTGQARSTWIISSWKKTRRTWTRIIWSRCGGKMRSSCRSWMKMKMHWLSWIMSRGWCMRIVWGILCRWGTSSCV